jgi:glyoxylate/hydroxypyruvate reductase A
VLTHHRQLGVTDANQARGVWQQIVTPPAQRRRVGVMGLGHIGGQCALTLATLGFDVAGWSRSPKSLPGVETFAGPQGLAPFLARTEILVCLLPLTPETKDILNARTFAALPRGAAIVNAGRGGHLVEADLLAALDGGHLSGATLDVFRTEPLPPDHPFWSHPRIRVTPHIASYIDPATGAGVVAENIRRYEVEGRLADMSDAVRGY